MFQKATRKQSKLRMTIDGPAGSGKTYTSMRLAFHLAQGGRVAVLDTEHGSASKYSGEAPDGISWDFDVAEIKNFAPEKYTEAITAAGRAGYAVLVIDSLSHAWEGQGGALEKVGGNVTNWKTVTPLHQRMIDAILQSPMHIITTMRSRMEHVIDRDEQTGKVVGVRKVGMAPIQRPGMEYEFDIVADMDWSHSLTVSKSRCSAVQNMRVDLPGPSFIEPVIAWLNSGTPSKRILNAEELMAQYGIDAILTANGGAPPANDAEWQKVASLLSKE